MTTQRYTAHSNDAIRKIIVRKYSKCKEIILKIWFKITKIIPLNGHQIDFLSFNFILVT